MISHTSDFRSLTVFVYHDEPPLHLDNNRKDLSSEWVDSMNNHQEKYRFIVKRISRTDLNTLVASDKPFMILWANPLWFHSYNKNIEASIPLFWDAEVIVSLQNHPVRFESPEGLKGFNIGVRKGHYYKGLMGYFTSQKINRIDTDSSMENFARLVHGDIDAYIDSRSSVLYNKRQNNYSESIFVSQLPLDAYSRQLLVSHHYLDLLPSINKAISDMKTSKDWQNIINQFGIERLVDPFELELEELNKF